MQQPVLGKKINGVRDNCEKWLRTESYKLSLTGNYIFCVT